MPTLAARSRPSTRQLLNRILETPDLAAEVRSLAPPILRQLIDRIGLEDAGEVVAFATTEQLAAVFDEDLWRSDRAGEDERFDADRFLVWLEVMLEAGDRFVAMKLFELPTELVILAFHKHLLVLDMDALVAEMQGGGDDIDQIEKALSDCLFEELEEYRLIARRHEGWDNLLTAILALDRDHHDYLATILDRCAKMGSEHIEDNGGLYEVLTAEEMLEGDVAADREDRRAEAGHVAPTSAAAFLRLARMPASKPEERDPLTKAYFRSLTNHSTEATVRHATTRGAATARPRQDLLQFLREAEIVEREPPRLVDVADGVDGMGGAGGGGGAGGAGGAGEESRLLRALGELAAEEPTVFSARSEELAYLANVLASGCSYRGRRLRPVEAVQAALTVTNLGLEIAASTAREAEAPLEPEHLERRLRPDDLERRLLRAPGDVEPSAVLCDRTADELFRIAWRHLETHIIQPTAETTVAWLTAQAKAAPDKTAFARAARRVAAESAKGTPWLALSELEALGVLLRPEIVEMLSGLIDECPTMRGVLRAGATDGDAPRFIGTLADVALVHRQLVELNPRRGAPATRGARGARGARDKRAERPSRAK